MTDLNGQLINGRYQILREQGTGGMAQVYLARDRRFRRDVIVKLVHEELLRSPEADDIRAQFRDEAHLMLRLKHPNIVAIYEYGEFKGRPFVVLEPLMNNSLSRRLSEFGDHQRAGNLLATIAEALQHMHDRRIVHCDVKPDNILFDEHDTPKLTDFGVAQLLPNEYQNGDGAQPTTPFLQGTPQYMAPEQWRNALSPQSDQYALGVILYELLTREWPFSGTTPLEIGDAHLQDEIPAATHKVADLPEEVDLVIVRLLAKNPEDRYPSLADAANALRELARIPLTDGEKKRRKAVERRQNRKRWIWWLLGSVLALLVVAVITVVLFAGFW